MFVVKVGGLSVWRETRLTVDQLAFSRGERPLVAGLSLALKGGDAVALVGPNGSGKTSLLRVLAGLAEPGAGEIRVTVGEIGGDTPRSALCHLGGHSDGLKGALTVEQNLAFWCAYFGQSDTALSIPDALGALGIGHVLTLPAAILSQGQKRRVALARLLVAPRPIWLLDEPTAALDAASTAQFLSLLETHRAAGGIVVAATHTPLALEGLQTLDLADFPPHHETPSAGSTTTDAGDDYWLGNA